MIYFVAPFIGWVVSGLIKFTINYFRFGSTALQMLGNGGFPSTHTTIMVTVTTLIANRIGFNDPLFGLSVAVTFIIMIDALGLRKAVGKHAEILNRVHGIDLRESMGHSFYEVLGGCVLGILLGYILAVIFARTTV